MTDFIDLTSISDTTAYTTVDGSSIRELMHPEQHGNQKQSLAEATISAGCITRLHRHLITEELYHVTQGEGEMTLGKKRFPVKAGDTICILPGTGHQIRNTGKNDLKVLCCCAPHYTDADTELIDS
jgi:mannose-6-phosphate isomerase-like protein (cupin superfamily)